MIYQRHIYLIYLWTLVSLSGHAQESMNKQVATFASGCFWCTEAVFTQVKGVEKVVSGYTGGGHVKNPTYKEVCSGQTGHAECTQITFDASIVSYEELLEIFWNVHDPTTLNRQGNDVGTQYRSAIFYHNDQQKEIALSYKEQVEASGLYADPIVTEVTAVTEFFQAEDYHQNYYQLNPSQQYCAYVIRPKVEKFKKKFKGKLKH